MINLSVQKSPFFSNPIPGMAVVTALTHAGVLLVLHI